MRIMIASPVYDGNVRAEYMATVIGIMELLARRGIERDLFMRRGPLLHMNRNIIANRCLEQGYTHLLGLDTDISFEPRLIPELLDTGHEFLALACPFKEIQQMPLGVDPRMFTQDYVAKTARYNLKPLITDGKVTVQRGLLRATAVGAGAFLIGRTVLEKMIEHRAVDRYKTPEFFKPDYEGEHCHGFFDYVREKDDIWGEDYSFAKRWVDGCGGEIWCRIDADVTHSGPVGITGRYEKKLAAGVA